MSLLDKIKSNRLKLNQDLDTADKRRFFSPLTYTNYLSLVRDIPKYSEGKAIDLGCGDLQHKPLLIKYVDQYDSIDIEKRSEHVTYIGDIQNMDFIPDNSYDTAYSFSVLEHLPEPGTALNEACRILKPGGRLILVAPQMSRLHEEPHDYYRFTKYGLKYLLEKAGMEILITKPVGGIFSFLGHQISTIFLGLTWHIPLLNKVVFTFNKYMLVIPVARLDRIVDRTGLMASGLLIVARKPIIKKVE